MIWHYGRWVITLITYICSSITVSVYIFIRMHASRILFSVLKNTNTVFKFFNRTRMYFNMDILGSINQKSPVIKLKVSWFFMSFYVIRSHCGTLNKCVNNIVFQLYKDKFLAMKTYITSRWTWVSSRTLKQDNNSVRMFSI